MVDGFWRGKEGRKLVVGNSVFAPPRKCPKKETVSSGVTMLSFYTHALQNRGIGLLESSSLYISPSRFFFKGLGTLRIAA